MDVKSEDKTSNPGSRTWPGQISNEALPAFGSTVFLGTVVYYMIQLTKTYLWPISLLAEGAVLVALMTYYLFFAATKPVIYSDNNKLQAFLSQHVPVLQERYWVTPWAWSGFAQTVLASYLGEIRPFAPAKLQYAREVLTLRDGGEVALDWKHECLLKQVCQVKGTASMDKHDVEHPVVLILPGITGSSEDFYVRSIISELSSLGACCVVFNSRGLGGMRLKTARTHNACNTEDLTDVVQHLKRVLPAGTPIASVGVSLGALLTCHYLSKKGKDSGLVASVVICPPWDTPECMELLESGWPNTAINRYLADALKAIFSREKELFQAQMGHGPAADATIEHILSSRTMREFDHRFTAPHYGYPSAEAYYADARMTDKLRTVRTPLLALSAADDPLLPETGIPTQFGADAAVAVAVTRRGGHIGYLEGVVPYYTPPYYSKVVREFLGAVFVNRDAVREIVDGGTA